MVPFLWCVMASPGSSVVAGAGALLGLGLVLGLDSVVARARASAGANYKDEGMRLLARMAFLDNTWSGCTCTASHSSC